MNITDLIVEVIKQGNIVEIPGMGTIASVTEEAHHDAVSGTYYPSRRTVAFSKSTSGNKSIIHCIAERECVSDETAEMIWNNYVGALDDKLKRSAQGHEFPGLGTMRREGTAFSFQAIEGLDLDAEKHFEQPLENVATYVPKGGDPFAAFEKPVAPAPKEAEAPKPFETPKVTDTPKPVETPKPVDVPKPVETPKIVTEPKPVEEIKPIEEIKPVEVVKPAEVAQSGEKPVEVAPESVKPTFIDSPKPVEPKHESIFGEIPTAAPVSSTNEKPSSAAELDAIMKELNKIPTSAPDKKSQRKAAKAAEKAEKEAAKAAKKAQKEKALAASVAALEAKSAEKAEKKAKKEAEKLAKHQQKQQDRLAGNEKEKKGKGWLVILIIVLLLVSLGGGAYYYFTQVNPDFLARPVQSAQTENVNVGNENNFTNSLDMLQFSQQDVLNDRERVCMFMGEYIHTFLSARHYTNARVPMMQRIREYSEERLSEELTDGYAVQRFFPYNDYIREYRYNALKGFRESHARCKVQSELMNVDFLDKMLDDLIAELGLSPDGFGVPAAAPVAKAQPVQEYKEIVPEAPTRSETKQGFDIIAGFFTNKNNANKMTNQLKSLGCDAYIINRSGLYYVSMGSAPTQTAAESLYNHIKSWYKGDIAIKEWK